MMMKLLNCELFELGRMFNHGIWVKQDNNESYFYDFSDLNFKSMSFGLDANNKVYIIIYGKLFYLDDHMKTWWFDEEKFDVK